MKIPTKITAAYHHFGKSYWNKLNYFLTFGGAKTFTLQLYAIIFN